MNPGSLYHSTLVIYFSAMLLVLLIVVVLYLVPKTNKFFLVPISDTRVVLLILNLDTKFSSCKYRYITRLMGHS